MRFRRVVAHAVLKPTEDIHVACDIERNKVALQKWGDGCLTLVLSMTIFANSPAAVH
jgi:hypothetical protein